MDRNLNDALFFTEVVEYGSFSAAARGAGVPVSTVSRRIARLEFRLGIALLTRTTRSLALTDAGRIYYDHAIRAVDEVDNGERLVQDLRSRPKGRIRMAAPQGIALFLWPAIAEFLEQFSDVNIELHAHERRINLVEEGYDLAAYTGILNDSSMMARKVLDGEYGLFASPAYIARRGRPRTTRDLEQHDCIVVGEGAKRVKWSLRQGRQEKSVSVQGRVRVNETGLAFQATLDGYGIARLPAALAAKDLRDGRLERLLPNIDGGPTPVWIIYSARRHLSAGLRALIDHLVARLPRFYDQKKRLD